MNREWGDEGLKLIVQSIKMKIYEWIIYLIISNESAVKGYVLVCKV